MTLRQEGKGTGTEKSRFGTVLPWAASPRGTGGALALRVHWKCQGEVGRLPTVFHPVSSPCSQVYASLFSIFLFWKSNQTWNWVIGVQVMMTQLLSTLGSPVTSESVSSSIK